MDDAYAPPTPLSGPHALPRALALRHWFGRDRDRARVYVLPSGACRVLRRGERLNLRAALAAGYRGVYFVDEDSHTTDVECDLPSSEAGAHFTGRVRLIWWVHDVEQAVQARVGDVRNALRPFLESYLGRLSREHPQSAIGAAEDRLRRELAGDLPLEIGLTIRPLTMSLRGEEQVSSYDDRLADVQREILLEEARGRLEVIRARNEVAAWEVKLEFYRNVVESGLPAILALRLMTDPASAGEVAGFTAVPEAEQTTSLPRWSNGAASAGELIGIPDESRPRPARPDPAVHPRPGRT